jgi:hypothetical protein
MQENCNIEMMRSKQPKIDSQLYMPNQNNDIKQQCCPFKPQPQQTLVKDISISNRRLSLNSPMVTQWNSMINIYGRNVY